MVEVRHSSSGGGLQLGGYVDVALLALLLFPFPFHVFSSLHISFFFFFPFLEFTLFHYTGIVTLHYCSTPIIPLLYTATYTTTILATITTILIITYLLPPPSLGVVLVFVAVCLRTVPAVPTG